MSLSFLVQNLIDKMQIPSIFSANCGQDCGIPRGIVKHSFGNQIYIQCKLPLVAQHSFNRISKNIEERENQNIFKEFFCCRKCASQSFWFYFMTRVWKMLVYQNWITFDTQVVKWRKYDLSWFFLHKNLFANA